MNGKLRKIGLAMSGLMCAGMLFTCALPAKAAVNACNHMSRLYLGEFDIVEKDYFDNVGHFIRRETRACCETCGKILVLRSEIVDREDHHIFTLTDQWDGFTLIFCDKCNFTDSCYAFN